MKGTRRGHTHDAFPVRTVARLTGLSPDLIRAWEKRHGVVAPVRGPRGARLYSAGDIEHLRLLARAVGSGRAIGDIAQLGRAALEDLTRTSSETEPTTAAQVIVSRLLEAVSRGDAVALDRQLSEALVALGGSHFVRQLAAPLLTQVGERWSAGHLSIADEHLLSGAIRGVLTSLIRFRGKAAEAPTVLLATPSGERHELGLLLVALLAADAGLGLHYLGCDLPAAEILSAARRADAAVVGLSVVNSHDDGNAADEVRRVDRALPAHTELWLGGRNAGAVASRLRPTRALVLDDLVRVEAELARVQGTPRRIR